MRKFYKSVSVKTSDDGFQVCLDGKPIKSPLGSRVLLPTESLAKEIVAEWDVEADDISPEEMPLTRFANTSFDRVGPQRQLVLDEIASFGDTDLLCYRALNPDDLVEAQRVAWDPVLKWLAQEYGLSLKVTDTVLHTPQNEDDLNGLKAILNTIDDFRLSALHSATSILGSVVLSLALLKEELTVDESWDASRVDENYQVENWGEDYEAQKKADNDYKALVSAAKFMKFATINT